VVLLADLSRTSAHSIRVVCVLCTIAIWLIARRHAALIHLGSWVELGMSVYAADLMAAVILTIVEAPDQTDLWVNRLVTALAISLSVKALKTGKNVHA
jgi:hypothetical protein